MRRSPATWAVAVTTGALMTAVIGCSSDAPTPTTTVAAAPTSLPRVDDGTLRIGVLTPQGSANADIGEAIHTGVALAVEDINNAGGYNGKGVVLVPADEGVAGFGADPAIATLLDDNVDAIIGPASSLNALSGLGKIVEAGVVACSPTASASLLDDFPDRGLFFRTIPSDTLQAAAIVEAVDRTGASQVTVAFIDDDYGQAFADHVATFLRRKNIHQNDPVPYSSNNLSIGSAAKIVAATKAGVVVVIGDATSGPVMMEQIDKELGSTGTIYVVNDAMRRPTASAEPMGGSLAARVTGVSPVAYSSDPQFLLQLGPDPDNSSPYASNAFDCANLIALGALAAKSTQPTAIAAEIPAVSDGGTPCTSFADCRTDIAAGSNINYDGPGGPLTLGSNGDLSSAAFEVFGFDQTGRDYNKSFVMVHA
jgi:branched-chain amino acid transport system substrate-binding protein